VAKLAPRQKLTFVYIRVSNITIFSPQHTTHLPFLQSTSMVLHSCWARQSLARFGSNHSRGGQGRTDADEPQYHHSETTERMWRQPSIDAANTTKLRHVGTSMSSIDNILFTNKLNIKLNIKRNNRRKKYNLTNKKIHQSNYNTTSCYNFQFQWIVTHIWRLYWLVWHWANQS